MARRIRQLFSPPEVPISLRTVIVWWEKRRLIYNVFVLSTAVIVLIIFYVATALSGELEAGEDAVEPLAVTAAISLLLVFSNVFYTLGWLIEISVRAFSGSRFRRLGPCLFAAGLVLSLVVVGWPALAWLANISGLTSR